MRSDLTLLQAVCPAIDAVARTSLSVHDVDTSQWLGGGLAIDSVEMIEIWFHTEKLLDLHVPDEAKRDVYTLADLGTQPGQQPVFHRGLQQRARRRPASPEFARRLGTALQLPGRLRQPRSSRRLEHRRQHRRQPRARQPARARDGIRSNGARRRGDVLPGLRAHPPAPIQGEGFPPRPAFLLGSACRTA